MKRFEEHNDAFADILNGLVFNGEQVICGEELSEHENAENFYDECAALGISRATSKMWHWTNFRIICVNQLSNDFVKKIQLLDENENNRQLSRKRAERYQVITVVLYFGNDYIHNLLDFPDQSEFDMVERDWLANFNNKYFCIPRLELFDLDKFEGDFAYVAWFYCKKLGGMDYPLPDVDFLHPEEMRELIGDMSF